MIVSADDMAANFERYLEMLAKGDIVITRNGQKIARLVKDEDDPGYGLPPLTGHERRSSKAVIRAENDRKALPD